MLFCGITVARQDCGAPVFRNHECVNAWFFSSGLDYPYAAFCLAIGEGTFPTCQLAQDGFQLSGTTVELPYDICAPSDWTPLDLLNWVYDGFADVPPAAWPQYYASRSVLAPTNEAADTLNEHMLLQLDASSEEISYSRDIMISEVEMQQVYAPEFLHSLNCTGLPPHALRLRKGELLILLRNYAPHRGLCNGTRLVVDRIRRRLLVVRIVTGPFRGNVEVLPRISCDSTGTSELPFVLRRIQYPVRPAWCMTINKSQGQTIPERLGIYLPSPIFSHGQVVIFSSLQREAAMSAYLCKPVSGVGDSNSTTAFAQHRSRGGLYSCGISGGRAPFNHCQVLGCIQHVP